MTPPPRTLEYDNSHSAALGSWADEMDAMPLPSAAPGYSSRRDDRGGDAGSGKATWERSSSGMGGPPSRGGAGGFGGTGMFRF